MNSFSKLSEYSSQFQSKVIKQLLTNKKFLNNIYDSVEVEYFENTSQKWIVEFILKYHQEYHTYPTLEVLNIEYKKIDNKILKIAIKEQLKDIFKNIDDEDSEYIQNEFLNFCKNQKLKNALLESVDRLQSGEYDDIRILINNALKAGQERNIGHEYNIDAESRYRGDDRRPIPFPWKEFNNMTQGGYGKGDLVLIAGNPGGGKSWVVTAMGAYAASLGYNVLHYSLELGEGYVGKRYDSVLTGIPVDELGNNRSKVEEVLKNLKGKIIIKEYAPKRASIDTIKQHIEQLKEVNDFVPDMIIIDYLDYLRPYKSKKDRKEDIDDVYVAAKGLAKELQLPVISPSQVNRTGAGSDIIEGTSIAGSYDKLMIGDEVMSLSRKRKDKVEGTGRFHWIKNRFGPDGMTYNSKINTSNGHIEITGIYDEEGEEDIVDSMGFDKDDKQFLKEKSKEFFRTA